MEISFSGRQRKMNTTVMLTYYYDEQSEYNNSTHNETTDTRILEDQSDLSAMDRAHNPALIHHLYLGLGHMAKAIRLFISFMLRLTFLL